MDWNSYSEPSQNTGDLYEHAHQLQEELRALGDCEVPSRGHKSNEEYPPPLAQRGNGQVHQVKGEIQRLEQKLHRYEKLIQQIDDIKCRAACGETGTNQSYPSYRRCPQMPPARSRRSKRMRRGPPPPPLHPSSGRQCYPCFAPGQACESRLQPFSNRFCDLKYKSDVGQIQKEMKCIMKRLRHLGKAAALEIEKMRQREPQFQKIMNVSELIEGAIEENRLEDVEDSEEETEESSYEESSEEESYEEESDEEDSDVSSFDKKKAVQRKIAKKRNRA